MSLKMKLYKFKLIMKHLSAKKQSLNNFFFDSSFFKHTSKFNELFLPPDTALINEIKLKYQKRDPGLKFIGKWITENSHPMTKTPIITASPFLLEYYKIYPILYSDEHTGLINITKLPPLKNNDKLTVHW